MHLPSRCEGKGPPSHLARQVRVPCSVSPADSRCSPGRKACLHRTQLLWHSLPAAQCDTTSFVSNTCTSDDIFVHPRHFPSSNHCWVTNHTWNRNKAPDFYSNTFLKQTLCLRLSPGWLLKGSVGLGMRESPQDGAGGELHQGQAGWYSGLQGPHWGRAREGSWGNGMRPYCCVILIFAANLLCAVSSSHPCSIFLYSTWINSSSPECNVHEDRDWCLLYPLLPVSSPQRSTHSGPHCKKDDCMRISRRTERAGVAARRPWGPAL